MVVLVKTKIHFSEAYFVLVPIIKTKLKIKINATLVH